MSVGIFEIDGIQEVSREIRTLSSDKMKRNQILKILLLGAKFMHLII